VLRITGESQQYSVRTSLYLRVPSFVVSLGVQGITGFLPLGKSGGLADSVVPGQPVECVVHSVNEAAHTVNLSARPKDMVKASVRSSKLPFRALSAGMVVDAIVDKVVQVRAACDHEPHSTQVYTEWRGSMFSLFILRCHRH
jgi:hypothetical protein